MTAKKLPKYKVEAAEALAKFTYDIWGPLFRKYWGPHYDFSDFKKGTYQVISKDNLLMVTYFPYWSEVSLRFLWNFEKQHLMIPGELSDVFEQETNLDFSSYEETEYEAIAEKLNSPKGMSFVKNALTLFYKTPTSKSLYLPELYAVSFYFPDLRLTVQQPSKDIRLVYKY